MLREKIFKCSKGNVLFEDCFNNHSNKIANTKHRTILSLEQILLDKIVRYGKNLQISAPTFEYIPQEKDEEMNPFITHHIHASSSGSRLFEHKQDSAADKSTQMDTTVSAELASFFKL